MRQNTIVKNNCQLKMMEDKQTLKKNTGKGTQGKTSK